LALGAGAIVAACGADPEDNAVDAGDCPPGPPESVRVEVGGGVELHALEWGCGAPVVLLHGFPSFSFSWEPVAPLLADRFRVIAPDQRGYHPSDIPTEVVDYEVATLAADVAALIEARAGGDPVVLVGHDWGGAVAWVTASAYPALVRGLVVINGPHPDIWARELEESAEQKQASQYITLFLDPSAEETLSANDHAPLISGYDNVLTAERADRYRAAWSVPGTLTGGLNWYRANLVAGPVAGPAMPTGVTVSTPTRVLWGMMDRFLLPGNLTGLEAYVPDLDIVEWPDAGHWITYEEPAGISAAIAAFADGL
jgi:epoxide hydrolase 4